jgi:DNA-binding XRE family transcriptional regulator
MGQKMNRQTIKSPSGDTLVVIPLEEFEDLVDAAAYARAKSEDDGARLSRTEVEQLLGSASPVQFWRKKRGLTQADLAAKAGISQNYLSSIETGGKGGTPMLLKALAEALGVKMEDLV